LSQRLNTAFAVLLKREPVNQVADVTDYLRQRIAEVRLARLVGEAVWASGAFISIAGLFLRHLLLSLMGFSLLFVGLVLSVHYEFQLRDYMHALEDFARPDK
jgi:hypothetical protein